MDAYEMLKKVGQGTYGKVYRAREKVTGKIVAIKKSLPFQEGDNQEIELTTLREISFLEKLANCDCIIRLFDVKQNKNRDGNTIFYLVFEYMDTDLYRFIRRFQSKGETIDPQTVKSLMYQLCEGVAFCHRHEIIHRDLKPENLLVDRRTMRLKIADFGLCRSVTEPLKKYSHKIGTLWYKAPEMLLGAPYFSTPIDMWSVGCIFAELVTNKPLFPGVSDDGEQNHLILSLLGAPDGLASVVPNLDSNGLDLLFKLLQYEPSDRITAEKALEHPYFDDLRHKASTVN